MAPVIWDGVHYTNNESAFQSAKLTSRIKRQYFSELDPSSAKKRKKSPIKT